MIRAIIPASDYVYMTRFASKDDTRFWLEGVAVEAAPDAGALLVATSGHVLGAMRLDRSESYFTGENFILAADKNLIRACKVKKNDHAVIVCREDRVDVIVTRYGAPEIGDLLADKSPAPQCSFPPALYIDGTFPNWRAVMPRYDRESAYKRPDDVGINAELIALFNAPNKPGVSFDWNGPDPIAVLNHDPRFYGIIMPMRDGLERSEFDRRRDWIIQKAEAAATQAA